MYVNAEDAINDAEQVEENFHKYERDLFAEDEKDTGNNDKNH